MTRAVLSLGSNQGEPTALLGAAVAALAEATVAVSSYYRTPPWGPVDQDDFVNLAMIVEDDRVDAAGWWARAQRLEAAAHRTRDVRWGPRTLDVDVIAVWNRIGTGLAPVLSDDPGLTLPHPRAAQRAFVLLPWLEIDPAARLPGIGDVAVLASEVDRSGIVRLDVS